MIKKTENSNPLLKSSPFLGIVIGAAVMFLTVDFWNTNNAEGYSNEYAKVRSVNGLYVFLGSEPACSDCYEVLGEFQSESLLNRAGEIGIGKEKAGKVLENIFSQTQKRFNLQENINELTRGVRQEYRKADAIMMDFRLNKCTVIKYK